MSNADILIASKLQSIPDSAGHHIVEGRWLRNPQYTKDLIQLYTRGGLEIVSGITYTHYVHRAIYEHAQAIGDTSFLLSQLEGMEKTFDLWNVTIDPTVGLYHRNPLQDAQEYSLIGYLVGGPNGGPMQNWIDPANDYNTIWLGPETYRPDFNAYMVAAASSIAEVARLSGNTSLAQQWNSTSATIYSRMENFLYDAGINFWIDVAQGSNYRAIGRQLIGYFPYRFDVGTDRTKIAGLEAGLDTQHFITEFGPTTLEQISPYYLAEKNTTYCCLWQGQSWPFSTSVYLITLAKLARTNASSVVTPALFQDAFHKYTMTNYKDGYPYTAESHYPVIDTWSGDTTNHSEHYLHSTYLDNFFTNLIGVIPTLDDRLELRPLVPSNWSYFAIENLPYHGSLISILWDASGSHYTSFNHSIGLSVYSNGRLLYNQRTLAPCNITLSNSTMAVKQLASAPRWANILANPNSPWGLPSVTADVRFSTNGDISPYEAWKMNDGLLWYDREPNNFWTNNQSTSPFSHIDITLPRPRTMSSISLAVIDDLEQGGVITCPLAINVTDSRTGTVLALRNPWTGCKGNALNTVTFNSSVTTDKLEITLTDQLDYAISITEVQIWVPENGDTGAANTYQVEDGLLGTFIGSFEGRMSGMNNTVTNTTSGTNGAVQMSTGAWAEVAGVSAPGDVAGSHSLTLAASGNGVVQVQLNFLANSTITVGGPGNYTTSVDMLPGENYVTFWWVSGSPVLDSFTIS